MAEVRAQRQELLGKVKLRRKCSASRFPLAQDRAPRRKTNEQSKSEKSKEKGKRAKGRDKKSSARAGTRGPEGTNEEKETGRQEGRRVAGGDSQGRIIIRPVPSGIVNNQWTHRAIACGYWVRTLSRYW